MKKLVHKIIAIAYRQLHRQFVLELTNTECDIEYILQLFEEIEKSELLTIAVDSVLKNSNKHMIYLKHQLRAFEEKKIIPDEIVVLHRKQIQKFDRYYSDIDRINRERSKHECF